MSAHDDGSRGVSDWIHEYAAHRVPEHLERVLDETSRRRQRPAWSILERWLPMDLTTRATAVAPPRIGRLLLVGLVILALALAAVVAVGTHPRRVPAPFGPADNGVLVYAADGDVIAYDPVSSTSTVLIRGVDEDGNPIVSPDGTRILFDRHVAGPLGHQLMVADIDGTHAVPLMAPVANVDSIAWSPDSKHVSMSSDADSVPAVRVAGLDGTVVTAIAQDTAAGHGAVEDVQWRPDSRQLVFRGWDAGSLFGLYIIGADGFGERPIVPLNHDPSGQFGAPALSPDGTTIAFTVGDQGRIHLVDVDSGIERPVTILGGNGLSADPVWSPDGTKILFKRLDGDGPSRGRLGRVRQGRRDWPGLRPR